MNQFEELKAEIAAAQSAIFDPLNSLIASAEDDASKYYDKGVKSAGNSLKDPRRMLFSSKPASLKNAVTV